jgi:hypothetical protein
MKDALAKKTHRRSGGACIVASVLEAADWAEGKPVPVRVSTVQVPVVYTFDTTELGARPHPPGWPCARSTCGDREKSRGG